VSGPSQKTHHSDYALSAMEVPLSVQEELDVLVVVGCSG